MVAKLLSGVGFGAESKALLASELGANAVRIRDGCGIGYLEDLLVVLPDRNDHKIVREGPWNRFERPNLPGPWRKEEGKLRHTEWTSLRDATGLEVGQAKPSSKGVVVKAVLVEVAVRNEWASGVARYAKKLAEERHVDLVEALPQVSRAPSKGDATKPGILQQQSSEKPTIFSTHRLASACI